MIIGIRDFIDELKDRGDLVEIDDEVDWDLEISAYESLSALLGGPAMLFNNIKGTQKGVGQVLVGHFSGTFRKPHRRIAMVLGINPDIDRLGFFEAMWSRVQNTLKPVEVATGPCKEVIKKGEDINLLEYPFLYHAVGDGARYILMGTVIAREPDLGYHNVSTHAIAIHSRNRLVVTPASYTNFALIYTNKYQARNEPMPVAIAIGSDPALSLASVIPPPPGFGGTDLAGGLRGSPMELVKAETSDIMVPANSEMVIEGEMRPYERLPEGPKIECFGFYRGPRQPDYAIRVNCITHRANPIIPETHRTDGCSRPSMIDAIYSIKHTQYARGIGLPVKAEFDSAATNGATYIYSLKRQAHPSFIRDLADKILAHRTIEEAAQVSLFVDDDVNNLEHTYAWEAMCTQINPARDIIISKGRHCHAIWASAWLEAEDLVRYHRLGIIGMPKLFFDATTKEEPPLGVKRTQFEDLIPDKLQKWVVDNWGRLGFKEESRWEKGWIETGF